MMNMTVLSFVLATLTVALSTIFVVRRMKRSDNPTEEYFTGGRSLGWPVIAGSLLLTNLSTEQLVGLNGAVFGDGNLVGAAWEVLAAFAMIATALFFLPRYLASGFTTTTAFLEKRFDRATRQSVAALFLFGYVTVLLPVVLYTGSLAIKTLFALSMPLWAIVLGIGVLGSGYAIFGGLKSVAVSDTFNGVGLLIGGLAIPVLALMALGDGSVFAGTALLLEQKPESLAVLASVGKRGQGVSVPWETLLTGMMFIQLFYWSTNQVIVQRAMGARSLAEGQKGVLFASLMKLVGPLMLCLPGIIALHMLPELMATLDLKALEQAIIGASDVPQEARALGSTLLASGTTLISFEQAEQLHGLGLSFNDQVYPAMVRHVLPAWSMGLFAAVLVGSILSSFNSAINSASTLFCLEFYEGWVVNRPFATPHARSTHIVNVGKVFGTALAVASMAIAPMLAQMESIFAYLQKVNGLYSVPIISIFLVGLLTKRSSAGAAKLALVVGLVTYGGFTFFPVAGLHWLHAYFICLVLAVGIQLIGARVAPRSDAQIAQDEAPKESPVDLTPWRHAQSASMVIVALSVMLYVVLQSLSV